MYTLLAFSNIECHTPWFSSLILFNLLIEPFAAYIRAHTEITGFCIGARDLIIILFADYVILVLTNIHPSLAAAHSILQLFNRLIKNKVNDNKLYIY